MCIIKLLIFIQTECYPSEIDCIMRSGLYTVSKNGEKQNVSFQKQCYLIYMIWWERKAHLLLVSMV